MKLRKNAKDLTGKIFGSYTVIGPERRQGKLFWKSTCICGKTRLINGRHLTSGYVHRCHKCALKDRFVDLTGKNFERWQVISIAHTNDNGVYFNCICSCGSKRKILGHSLVSGKSKGCIKCFKRINFIGKLSHSHFSKIKNCAIKRDIEFSITQQYMWDLYLKQNGKCELSGLEIVFGNTYKEEISKKTTASLDRIDNNKGYIEGNVQWVHKDINFMKHAYNQDYFIQMCKLISHNNEHKETENSSPDWKYWRNV